MPEEMMMNLNRNTPVGASAAAAFVGFGRYGRGVVFDAPNDGGTPAAPPAATPPAPEAPAPETPQAGMSDTEAKLLKEVMGLKTKLEGYEAEKAKATEATRAAEAKAAEAARAAELKAAQDAGDFERVKAMMAEEHKRELQAIKDEAKETGRKLKKAEGRIADLHIDGAFGGSKFIAEDLVLPAAKAKLVYGSHFAVEDGVVVGYDKPVGTTERTKLVDGQGKPIGFEDALRKLVEADPEKNGLLRSKAVTGTGSKTEDLAAGTRPATGPKGIDRIRAALKAKKSA